METSQSTANIVSIVLKAIAVAMGVAVVVLQTLGTATPSALITLLGIGLFALALDAFRAA
jgi:hypothetical protein